MHFINLSLLQRARIVLFINALILFLFIIFTPYFVKIGIWGIPEWIIEGSFLAIEISVLIKLFRNYDLHSKKIESKADKLKSKLIEQQETLTDSLEYLGKMNVQMSIVKKIMGKLKFPADSDKLEYILYEMLQSIVSLTKQKKIILKVVDLENKKTIRKIIFNKSVKLDKDVKKISNTELCSNKAINLNKYQTLKIISSNYDSFSLKTFVFFPKTNIQVDQEKAELVQGIVNQCEVIFLLFNSKYYQPSLK